MGRMLGYHGSDELDRPDLNKCPDCGCFFATDACPLCGMICPEEMRAGHRAKVRHKKHRSSSGRVQFIPWYYSWWFIIFVFCISRVAGIILFATSPYSKKLKITVTVIALAVALLSYAGVGYRLRGWVSHALFGEETVVTEATTGE